MTGIVKGRGAFSFLRRNPTQTELNDQLIAAAGKCDIIAIKKALEDGAEINANDGSSQMTALHHAASKGHTAAIQTLLEAGAKVDVQTDYKMTPLYYAADNGHTAAIQKLLEAGAAIDTLSKWEDTPLRIAAFHGHVGWW